MTDESLSALLDGECGPAELDSVLRDLDRNPALRRRFSEMCQARALRQGVRAPALRADFADRVLAALDPPAEPREPVMSIPPIEPARPVWQPLAGLALAASIAAVAVLALRPDLPPAPAPAVPVETVTVAVVPTLSTTAGTAEMPSMDALRGQQLRNYVMAYSESRAQQGLGGTLGYARFAAYSAAPAQGGAR